MLRRLVTILVLRTQQLKSIAQTQHTGLTHRVVNQLESTLQNVALADYVLTCNDTVTA